MSKRKKTLEYYLDLPYQLIITRDENGYGVEVAGLPGCGTFAYSWDDIHKQVREAMTSWIGSALKHGDPIPEPKG